jgi:hypothetical protein
VRDSATLSDSQLAALSSIAGKRFDYPWMLADTLGNRAPDWRFMEKTTVNKLHNNALKKQLDYVIDVFKTAPSRAQQAVGRQRTVDSKTCAPA